MPGAARPRPARPARPALSGQPSLPRIPCLPSRPACRPTRTAGPPPRPCMNTANRTNLAHEPHRHEHA
eukprot:1913996-Alexandrium_andersonii.AAC.1